MARAKRKAPAKKRAQTKQRAQARAPAGREASARGRSPRSLDLDEAPPGDEVLEIFRAFDRDRSGSIDAGELARLLEALGMPPSEEELAIALDVVDANHSGKISWPEFSAWWRAR